jgi:hypothetical protein
VKRSKKTSWAERWAGIPDYHAANRRRRTRQMEFCFTAPEQIGAPFDPNSVAETESAAAADPVAFVASDTDVPF